MREYLETAYDLHDPELVGLIDDTPLWSAPFGMALLDTVETRRDMRVLDIGSGTGVPVVELAQRLGSSCHVYGIDPWTEAIERARTKTERFEVNNLAMIEGRAEELPFADDFFDLVVSNNGTNNVEDEARVFEEVGRVARWGAQLVLTANLPDTMREFYDVFKGVLNEMGKTEEAEAVERHIATKRKPVAHTRRLVERNGFAVRNVFEDAFTLRYTDGTTMLAHFLIRFAFLGSWRSVVNPDDVAIVFAEVENELNAVARREGGLRLTVPWACFDCIKTQ
jgi:arsenite methyltransferase